MKPLKLIMITLVIAMIISISSFVVAEEISLGTKMGTFTETSEIIYVNGQRVQGYLVDDELAICIEDLKECGFEGVWDSILRRSTFEYVGLDRKDKLNDIIKSDINGNSIVQSDVEIFLAGDKIKVYSTGSYSLVKVRDLEDFGKVENGESVNITINDETLNNQEIVNIKNKELEFLIRKKLMKPYGSLYRRSLKNIESMTAGYLESLDDIEYLTNLKKLKVNVRPEAYYLEDLKKLKSLEELDIGSIETVKPIGQLTNLKTLSIKTDAYDLSPLSHLKQLTELSIELDDTQNTEVFKSIKDFHSLKKLKLFIEPKDILNTNLNKEYFKELNHLDEFELIVDIDYGIVAIDGGIDIREAIKDLSFLKDFTSVTKLSIYIGENQSLKGIELIENLKELEIYCNQYTDISPLKSLTQLEKLYIKGHSIDDLDIFQNMLNLKELCLQNNIGNISSLKPLENLKNLETVKLSLDWSVEEYKLKHVSSLGNLNKLENIELTRYKISDISWIKNLNNLKTVNLSNNDITNISAIAGLNNIEEINLSYNRLKNIDALNYSEKLKVLDISYNDSLDLPKNFYFPNIEVLYCEGNQIDDITFNQNMPRLEKLSLHENNLQTVNKMENIANVEQLILSENNITDINFLKDMVKLKELYISQNNISDIYPLSKLTCLEVLSINENKIHDETPLLSLVFLERLFIDEIDVSIIEELPRLLYPQGATIKRLNKGDTKTTYKGKILLDHDIELPEEGLKATIFSISYGMGGTKHEEVIKEIVIPYGKKLVEYEFDLPNTIPFSFYRGKSINLKTDNLKYELGSNIDFQVHHTTKNQVIDGCDIKVLERAPIKGIIILDDKILNMEFGDEEESVREIAVYARINGEKRRVVVSADLKQREIYYELYLPKQFAGKEFTLEYVIKKSGFIDGVAHRGRVGDILKREYLTERKELSPNIDEAVKIIFSGEDMVIDDIYVGL